MRVLVLAVFTLLWSVVLASSDAAFRPALYPLAIRTPYLQAWSNLTAFVAVDSSNNLWPNFWTDSRVLGWEGFLRVDNVAYKWIGGTAGYDIATFLNATMTPTRTIWTAKAGNMDVTITALSPIETSDLAKQSFPFVYISVNASSTDGQSHDVQVYMDISAEWVSGVDDVVVEWNTTQTSTSIYHQVYRQTKASMTETGGVADDSTAYIGMRSVSGLTWQTGEDTTCRGLFNETGALGNSADTDYRDIDTDWPVFAFSVDLGSISSTPSPTVFTIGLLRNPSIEVSYNGTEMRMPYFLLQESSIPDAIDTFLDDYEDASSRADALDEALMSAANSISSEFADLVALSTRQVMAGMEITLPSGATNASDVRIFMQNTGIDQRVDPVDTMFSAWPAILYLNASWASYILEPLLVYQSSSSYTYDYAANDLGTSFPVATGDSLQSDLGIENCGDMLIMALAHARVTGDGSLLSKYYTLFRKWGEYLVSNLPSPSSSQTASNNVSGGNSTNLAIKGIIAVKAMSVISHALGNTEDADIFASNATSLYNQWVKLSAGDNFLVEYYGNSSSWELMYNLYADKLLGTGVVADSIFSEQTTFYDSIVSSAPTYGLTYASNAGDLARSDWTLLTAATVTDSGLRDVLNAMVHERAFAATVAGTNPLMYNATNGSTTATYGQASPGQGAVFGLLALTLSNKTISVSEGAGSNKTGSSTPVGAIAGGVVGGIALVAVLGVIGFFFWRKRKQERQQALSDPSRPADDQTTMTFGGTMMSQTNLTPGTQWQTNLTGSPPQSYTPPTFPIAGYAPMSRKQMLLMQQQRSAPVPASDSGTEPTSSGASAYPVTASDDTRQLRNDLLHLQAEMEQLRRQREYDLPPPEYT